MSLSDWKNQLPLDVIQAGKTEDFLRRRATGEVKLAAAVRAIPRSTKQYRKTSCLYSVSLRA
jgi:hypothetical protein